MSLDTQTNRLPAQSLFVDILRSSGMYSVVLVGQRLAGVLLLPIYTRCLTPADYGTIEFLTQAIYVLSVLLGSAYSSALGFHYFQRASEEWHKTLASTCIFGSALLGVTGAALGWVLSVRLSLNVFHEPSFVPYFRILFVIMAVDFLLEGLMIWLRVKNVPHVYVIASLFRLGLTIAGTVPLLVVFHMGVAGVLVSNLVAASLTAAALVFYAFRRIGLRFDTGLFLRMLRFSLPLTLTNLALFFIHFGDRFFLQHYRTLADVGLYGLAYKIGMLVSLLYGTFHAYWSVQVFDILRRKDGDFIFARVFTYLMLIVAWGALGIVVFARPALQVLTTPAFQRAADLVPIIVLAYLIRAIGDFFRCLFLVENRPGFDTACNWLGAAVCLAGYFVLIPRLGSSGAALATLITFVVIAVVAVFWTGRLRPLPVEAGRLGKLAAAVCLLAALFFLLPAPTRIASEIGWAALFLASYPLFLILLRLPTKGEYSQVGTAFRAGLRAVRLWGRAVE